MVNYIGAYISEEYFYSRDTAVRWILLYHTSVTATLVPSYFIRLDTVYTAIGNKWKDVLAMVCCINVLYMLSYHAGNCYLI